MSRCRLIIAGVPRREIDKRVRAALDQVGLLGKEKSRPLELSTGEQQRVGIARAVVAKPTLLIADEPTGNLDPQLALEIMKLFKRFNEVGVTVVIATHDVHLIDQFGARRIVLERGTGVRAMSLQAYFARHAQTLIGSLGRIVHQPFATLMTMGVVAVALALPLFLNLLLTNVRTPPPAIGTTPSIYPSTWTRRRTPAVRRLSPSSCASAAMWPRCGSSPPIRRWRNFGRIRDSARRSTR